MATGLEYVHMDTLCALVIRTCIFPMECSYERRITGDRGGRRVNRGRRGACDGKEPAVQRGGAGEMRVGGYTCSSPVLLEGMGGCDT